MFICEASFAFKPNEAVAFEFTPFLSSAAPLSLQTSSMNLSAKFAEIAQNITDKISGKLGAPRDAMLFLVDSAISGRNSTLVSQCTETLTHELSFAEDLILYQEELLGNIRSGMSGGQSKNGSKAKKSPSGPMNDIDEDDLNVDEEFKQVIFFSFSFFSLSLFIFFSLLIIILLLTFFNF